LGGGSAIGWIALSSYVRTLWPAAPLDVGGYSLPLNPFGVVDVERSALDVRTSPASKLLDVRTSSAAELLDVRTSSAAELLDVDVDGAPELLDVVFGFTSELLAVVFGLHGLARG